MEEPDILFNTKVLSTKTNPKRSVEALAMERSRTPWKHPPFIKIGKKVLYSQRAYQAWLDSKACNGPDSHPTLTDAQRRAIGNLERAIAALKEQFLAAPSADPATDTGSQQTGEVAAHHAQAAE
ncbi:hypothetical protein [Mesorhizobium sp. M2C.T.Ca.TU.002.02.1.1]|uniref:hypothetical protein n=1 Tax=Mesorhizobium sp. M2C.T.Ca.TU.002.02.1.1 TaxID=2496788 RepID=UPI000FCB5A2A|nr:hypothetical protein [Mesorhizobium sp. M2C.T.Ca.TU.002.02.1.1]RUU59452.1 hypothetical protein EOD07_07100 [Mesorhizobium sp. M2C.T.Ca.TU.002.02.1.1]RUU69423.1 hypothetical protein EOD04_10575 [Mesorhizobium sp. M2C.T.Ca.TU.009.01.2.1]